MAVSHESSLKGAKQRDKDKELDTPTAARHYAKRLPLDSLFKPSSVAVIGATEKSGGIGRTILWNLISSPFGGTVFPVNPNRASVLGIRAYRVGLGDPGAPGTGGDRHARLHGPRGRA